MTEDQDRALVATFPLLYRDRGRSLQETAMCWGFEVGPGWYGLIRELSEALEKNIAQLVKENPGIPIQQFPAASQVKEKFGTLRFYLTTYTDEMDKAVQKACEKSATTCEVCGSLTGKMNAGPWLMVRCKEHWTSQPSYYDIDKYYQDQNDNNGTSTVP